MPGHREKSGKGYPYCEAVLLNCRLKGISPSGWGPVDGDILNIHYWEYNSINLNDGKPVDSSQRHEASKQLTRDRDAEILSNYSQPSFVIGWIPEMAPAILSLPAASTVHTGESVKLEVKVASIPQAACQWYKNGKIISNETKTVLSINKTSKQDEGGYSVILKNSTGSIKSGIIDLKITN